MNDAIRQRGFAVVNVSDDGEIADIFHEQQKGHVAVP
jgi:hypothetical protein